MCVCVWVYVWVCVCGCACVCVCACVLVLNHKNTICCSLFHDVQLIGIIFLKLKKKNFIIVSIQLKKSLIIKLFFSTVSLFVLHFVFLSQVLFDADWNIGVTVEQQFAISRVQFLKLRAKFQQNLVQNKANT